MGHEQTSRHVGVTSVAPLKAALSSWCRRWRCPPRRSGTRLASKWRAKQGAAPDNVVGGPAGNRYQHSLGCR